MRVLGVQRPSVSNTATSTVSSEHAKPGIFLVPVRPDITTSTNVFDQALRDRDASGLEREIAVSVHQRIGDELADDEFLALETTSTQATRYSYFSVHCAHECSGGRLFVFDKVTQQFLNSGIGGQLRSGAGVTLFFSPDRNKIARVTNEESGREMVSIIDSNLLRITEQFVVPSNEILLSTETSTTTNKLIGVQASWINNSDFEFSVYNAALKKDGSHELKEKKLIDTTETLENLKDSEKKDEVSFIYDGASDTLFNEATSSLRVAVKYDVFGEDSAHGECTVIGATASQIPYVVFECFIGVGDGPAMYGIKIMDKKTFEFSTKELPAVAQGNFLGNTFLSPDKSALAIVGVPRDDGVVQVSVLDLTTLSQIATYSFASGDTPLATLENTYTPAPPFGKETKWKGQTVFAIGRYHGEPTHKSRKPLQVIELKTKNK